MRQCGMWGTLKEISAAATLIQADILIFTYFGEEERRQQRFSPVIRNHTCTLPANGVKLHLYHTKSGDHYNRVVPQGPGVVKTLQHHEREQNGTHLLLELKRFTALVFFSLQNVYTINRLYSIDMYSFR